MHQFVKNLITEWRRLGLPFEGSAVVVAVSGGADSVSLLLAVHDLIERKKLNLRLIAAHFNHKLRKNESDEDEQYVKALCTRLGVELAIGHGSISPDGNLEQNARDARYTFLTKTAKNLDAFAVLTGHTVNDQAETFLLNLIRGSGPAGLSGMQRVRPLEGEKMSQGERESEEPTKSSLLPISSFPPLLARPLLTWARRKETEGFCREMGVEYRYDTMNEDTAFKRVRIRKILLPLLEDMNPNIIETLANTAALMQQIPSAKPNAEPGRIALKELAALPESELPAAIRSWIKANRGNTRGLTLEHIRAIGRLIHSRKSGRTAELPGGARVIKSGGNLTYEEKKVEN